MSSTVDRNARDQQHDTTEKEEGAADQRPHGPGSCEQPGQRHDGQNADRQPGIADEHLEQPAGDLAQDIHGVITPLGCRPRAAVPNPTSRNAAAKTGIIRSAPGHAIPRPSPVQKTPNAQRITPTANLSVFSGTRASGRRTIAPIARTTTQAASAPSDAGTSRPRPEPTAITMNTTSRPSSSTALNATTPPSQSKAARPGGAPARNFTASAAKAAVP